MTSDDGKRSLPPPQPNVALEYWTLVEAACYLSGIEPIPAKEFDPDLATGGLPAQIYRHLKDACLAGELPFIPSPNGVVRNHRVKPRGAVERAKEAGYTIPETLVAFNDDIEHREIAQHHYTKPVPLSFIASAFKVREKEHENSYWWNQRTRNAKVWALTDCRCTRGRGKRESTWYPDLVANWLVEKGHLTNKQAAALLRKHFPDCEEAAIQLEQSSD
jgi:hypothetical protein